MSTSSRLDPEPAPYILRSVLAKVPLAEDDDHPDAHITCVEFWGDNLYIGTSTAQILHYVLIPPDPSDQLSEAQFILASRLQPVFTGTPAAESPGVQQILVLPDAGRACILCNHTLTFYSLPELSPAYDGPLKLGNVAWVGGVDLNGGSGDDDDGEQAESAVIMICQRTRIRLVRVDTGPKPVSIRDVELGGCVATMRRGDIACAADNKSYSLVDVVAQQAIPLFEIASAGQSAPLQQDSSDDDEPPPPPPKDDAAAPNAPDVDASAAEPAVETPADPDEPVAQELPPRRSSVTPATEPLEEAEPSEPSPQTLRPPKPAKAKKPRSPKPSVDLTHRQIRPNIVSPTDSEFLLTTGTSFREPGVGMFVNLEGDVSRPTMEFSRYPHALALDAPATDVAHAPAPGPGEDTTWVLAIVDVGKGFARDLVIEIQDLDAPEESVERFQVRVPPSGNEDTHQHLGIRSGLASRQVALTEVIDMLRIAPLALDSDETQRLQNPQIKKREKSETEFVSRLSNAVSHLLVWNQSTIWTAVRAPMVLHFEEQLHKALQVPNDSSNFADALVIRKTLHELRGRDPATELEFLSTNYLRQKASLILFLDLLALTLAGAEVNDQMIQLIETSLIAGEVDPRLLLSVIPVYSEDLSSEDDLIWVSQGLAHVLTSFKQRCTLPLDTKLRPLHTHIFPLLKRYLHFWRQKKGFGSIADETNLFKSVDTALLHTLLILDEDIARGPATPGSVRRELNALVDKGVDCFDEAVALLERYKRLYVLSRLYQSRKQTASVLHAWQRILDGETDGDFSEPEQKMLSYLVQIRDRAIVEQYGGWLANRNPELGIRVFTESAKVRFTPEETLSVLRERAPGTVRRLLEHLVFEKHLSQYANNLISYYLDTVLDTLSSDPTARDTLRQTYKAYRALHPPKPTYTQFVADARSDKEWWAHRARLLQLLGGSHGAASSYDVGAILARIEPFKQELVPEMIILGGRQGRHREAIRLLTHGLGDYDTAIRYCVRADTFTGGTAEAADKTLQAQLFQELLVEFFAIEDQAQRVQQVSGLLERFAHWFDVGDVLDMVPDEWSVDVVAGFLQGSFRDLVSERHESMVVRGLSSTVHLEASSVLVEKAGVGGLTVSSSLVDE